QTAGRRECPRRSLHYAPRLRVLAPAKAAARVDRARRVPAGKANERCFADSAAMRSQAGENSAGALLLLHNPDPVPPIIRRAGLVVAAMVPKNSLRPVLRRQLECLGNVSDTASPLASLTTMPSPA